MEKVLRVPELLASVLRYLGPLDWLKCVAVCSWWSAAILDRDDARASPAAATTTEATTPQAQGRAPQAANLWREFVVTAIRYDDTESGNGGGRLGGGDGDGGSCCAKTPPGRNFYKNICLEGDPAVLGPPLKAAVSRWDVQIATVRLTDVVAASLARSRKPR